MRYFLDISYKGTHYAGWQKQPNALTVQEELERALTTVLRKETTCVGAGRTDTGVHARQLMIHLDLDFQPDQSFLHSLNGVLPYDIAVNQILLPQNQELHARFDATFRAYEYRIFQKKAPLDYEFAWWVRHPIDLAAMNQAAKLLFEFEEFGAFCKAHGANKTNFCRMMDARWEVLCEGEIRFYVKADRFLRGMVRALVGTLLWVGSNKISRDQFGRIIASQDRKQAGPAAPAKGLSLIEVGYPEGSFE